MGRDDRLERLLGRARGNFWDEVGEDAPPPLLPTERNSVKGDGFDRRAWDYLSDQIPALHNQVEELGEDFPTSPVAYEDLFRLLNQGDPRLVDSQSLELEYRPQRSILEAMRDAEDLKMVRKQTQYDDYNTGIALMTMKDRMRQAFEDLQEALDQIAAAQEALAEAVANAEAGQDPNGDGVAAAMDGVADANANGEAAQGAAEQAARGALRDAKKELDRQSSAASAYGLEDGQLQRMDFEERRRLTQALDAEKMQRLANLVGQFREYADAERRRKIISAPSEVHDVELGDNLQKIVAGEHINMAIPELEDLFWARYVKQGLLQRKVRGPNNAGRGPILVVCDESGSMSSPLDAAGNTREAWSKAVALALADQAKRSKRDFYYIGFSSAGQVWETSAERGELTMQQQVDFVSHFLCGGTSYERPLNRAMEICRSYSDRGGRKPDVVFVTDDECHVPDPFIAKWKADCKEIDIQCYGIRVGADAREDGWKSAMRSLCDRIINVNRLTAAPEDVKDLFRLI